MEARDSRGRFGKWSHCNRCGFSEDFPTRREYEGAGNYSWNWDASDCENWFN